MRLDRSHEKLYSTPPTVYHIILGLWFIVMVIFEYYTVIDGVIPTYQHGHPVYAGLIIGDQIFTAVFFYFGITNLVFPLRYQFIKKAEATRERQILNQPFQNHFHPKVQLLYTTYNDFMPYAFEQCLNQTYDQV